MTNDDASFDDSAFRAGRGLGSIGSTQPPLASVRRRVAARRVALMSTIVAAAAVAVITVSVQQGSTPTVVSIAASSTTSTPNVTSGLPVGLRVISPDAEGVRVTTSDSSRVVVKAENVSVAYEVSELDHFVYQTGTEGTWAIWMAERGVARELTTLRGKQLLSLGHHGPFHVLVLRDERSADGSQRISLYDLATNAITRTGIADGPGTTITMVSVVDDVFVVSGRDREGNDDFYFAKIDGSLHNDYANPNNAEAGESRRSRYAARLSADTKFVAYGFLGDNRYGIGVSLARTGDGFIGMSSEIPAGASVAIPADFDLFERYLLIPGSGLFDLQSVDGSERSSQGADPNRLIPANIAKNATLSRAPHDAGPPPTATSGSPVTSVRPTTAVGGVSTTVPQAPSITVAEPRSGAVVSAAGPLVVRGDALTFESTVNIKVYDAQGGLVVETFTMTSAPDRVAAPYSISIAFPTPVEHLGAGRLEVFEYSAEDGAEIHKVTVPITFVSAD